MKHVIQNFPSIYRERTILSLIFIITVWISKIVNCILLKTTHINCFFILLKMELLRTSFLMAALLHSATSTYLIGYDIYMHVVPEWIKWFSEHFNLQAVKGYIISMRIILEWIKWYNVLIYRLPSMGHPHVCHMWQTVQGGGVAPLPL